VTPGAGLQVGNHCANLAALRAFGFLGRSADLEVGIHRADLKVSATSGIAQ
jgi:hypothetical protein